MYYLMLVGLTGDANYNRVGEKWLYFSEEKVSWFKAYALCRTMDGYLTSLENKRVWESVNKHLKTNFSNDSWFWISGNDLASSGNFVWANTGTSMNYSVWSEGQPKTGKNCVNLQFTNDRYEMNNLDCHHFNYFICEPEHVDVPILDLERELQYEREYQRDRDLERAREMNALDCNLENEFNYTRRKPSGLPLNILY
uniref:C-type lectin domain-containing protein n=1 Tax=Glossina brevipalpis TaxID=37001 RepID=A0A1A9WN44_9MUSC